MPSLSMNVKHHSHERRGRNYRPENRRKRSRQRRKGRKLLPRQNGKPRQLQSGGQQQLLLNPGNQRIGGRKEGRRTAQGKKSAVHCEDSEEGEEDQSAAEDHDDHDDHKEEEEGEEDQLAANNDENSEGYPPGSHGRYTTKSSKRWDDRRQEGQVGEPRRSKRIGTHKDQPIWHKLREQDLI
jgi:hypothetical protein